MFLRCLSSCDLNLSTEQVDTYFCYFFFCLFSRIYKDLDLTDISVSSEGTVDLTDFDSLSESKSDNNNGDVRMLMIIITHLAMCYNM